MCSAGLLDTSAYVLHVTDLKPCNNERGDEVLTLSYAAPSDPDQLTFQIKYLYKTVRCSVDKFIYKCKNVNSSPKNLDFCIYFTRVHECRP